MAPSAEAVLDPRGDVEEARTGQLAPRNRSLRGSSLGLLNNAKPNAAVILEELASLLRADYGVERVMMLSKSSFAVPAEDALLGQLAETCDFVIAGVGDCGSCSAGTVADGVLLERRGVPAVSICTDTFLLSGEAMARLQGFPGYSFVTVPHPIASLDRPELEKLAVQVLPDVLKIFEVTA